MCGLVSVISKNKGGLFHSDLRVFTEMLFADQLRGADGTGIFFNTKDKIRVLKAPYASSDFVNDVKYDKAVDEATRQGNFVVGHNRAATKGQRIHEHTHPFIEGHIVLVHNGTLINHKNLKDVEVDSHAICHSIATSGIEKTVEEINGAYALIWYNSKEKTLNFIRNGQRPLYIVETDYNFILVSEQMLARWICDRNNQKVIKVSEVPVHTLHTFKVGEWDKYSTKSINPYVHKCQVPYQNQMPHYNPPSVAKTTSPQIGDAIKFIPTRIDPTNTTKLIGEWEDTNTGELVEVRFWATNKTHAEELLKATLLQGSISHTAWNSKEKSRFFILKDAYVTKVTPINSSKEVAVAFNKRKLTKEDIKKIKPACTMCGGQIGNLYHACNITQGPGDSLIGTCPDCTEWIYHDTNQQYYPF